MRSATLDGKPVPPDQLRVSAAHHLGQAAGRVLAREQLLDDLKRRRVRVLRSLDRRPHLEAAGKLEPNPASRAAIRTMASATCCRRMGTMNRLPALAGSVPRPRGAAHRRRGDDPMVLVGQRGPCSARGDAAPWPVIWRACQLGDRPLLTSAQPGRRARLQQVLRQLHLGLSDRSVGSRSPASRWPSPVACCPLPPPTSSPPGARTSISVARSLPWRRFVSRRAVGRSRSCRCRRRVT